MVWIETDRDGTGRCRSHPHHTQSEGVCSSCLTERLAGLTSAAGAGAAAAGSCSSSGTNSPPESSRSSIHVSPALRHRRNASETASVAASVSDGLKKSRSVACAAARSRGEEGKGSKKKGWFWSRLLRSTAAKRGGRDGGAVASVADS